MKKGDLSIQYVFLIFIAVIAVFVIIGILSRWSLGTNRFMCKLTGECDNDIGVDDKKTIVIDGNENQFRNEIIKQSKLCYERIRGREEVSELCYTIKCGGCTTSCDAAIISAVENSVGADHAECADANPNSKFIIEYNFDTHRVRIS